jgi:hypothetical protein
MTELEIKTSEELFKEVNVSMTISSPQSVKFTLPADWENKRWVSLESMKAFLAEQRKAVTKRFHEVSEFREQDGLELLSVLEERLK